MSNKINLNMSGSSSSNKGSFKVLAEEHKVKWELRHSPTPSVSSPSSLSSPSSSSSSSASEKETLFDDLMKVSSQEAAEQLLGMDETLVPVLFDDLSEKECQQLFERVLPKLPFSEKDKKVLLLNKASKEQWQKLFTILLGRKK